MDINIFGPGLRNSSHVFVPSFSFLLDLFNNRVIHNSILKSTQYYGFNRTFNPLISVYIPT